MDMDGFVFFAVAVYKIVVIQAHKTKARPSMAWPTNVCCHCSAT